MKLASRLLIGLFMWQNAQATLPIVISYNQQSRWADRIVQIVKQNLNVPEELILKKWSVRPCQIEQGALLQICLKDDYQISYPILEIDQLRKSFLVFQKK